LSAIKKPLLLIARAFCYFGNTEIELSVFLFTVTWDNHDVGKPFSAAFLSKKSIGRSPEMMIHSGLIADFRTLVPQLYVIIALGYSKQNSESITVAIKQTFKFNL
jgi:hypothetical protein